MPCIVLPLAPASLERCARALVAGELVAFPTETVYGLGAHALDERAVDAIFAAKGRPAGDPLIVHTADAADALALAAPSPFERRVLERLAERFWPGPLTLVTRASSIVPRRVTAGGEFVGLRVPSHPVARALLTAARVPVAAPSANRFGHVSPTSAAHVAVDLARADLLILDGGECPVGIESTVARVTEGKPVEILRRGAIGRDDLARALEDLGVEVVVRERHATVAETESAPGQLLTHYAPTLPAFLLDELASEIVNLVDAAVIDFAGRHVALRDRARSYEDLAPDGDPAVAAARLFAALRSAESVEGARAVLLVDLRGESDPTLQAIADRLLRAASGRTARGN